MRRKWVVVLQVFTEVEAEGRDEAKSMADTIVRHGPISESDGEITDVDVMDSYALVGKGPVQAAAEDGR